MGGGEEEEGGGGEKVCDTELCLSSGGWRRSSGSSSSSSSAASSANSASRRGNAVEEKQEDGKIAMLYNGRICVCDVTEIQARGIISMARSNDKEQRPQGVAYGSNMTAAIALATAALPSSDRSLSMKRSLQRFLEKRKKARSVQASSSPCRRD